MVTFPIYLYNTQLSPISFIDIGLELLSHDFFEIDSIETFNHLYKSGNSLSIAIANNTVLISTNTSQIPPNTNKLTVSEITSSPIIGNIDGGKPNSIYSISQINVINAGGP